MSLIIVMLHTENTETGSRESDIALRAVACVVLSGRERGCVTVVVLRVECLLLLH